MNDDEESFADPKDEEYTELCLEYEKLQERLNDILNVMSVEDLIRIAHRLKKKGKLRTVEFINREMRFREREQEL
jgi:hypothetical protein